MKNFERLNKNEMKMVMGGTEPIGEIDGCDASTCNSNADCKETNFPRCYFATCNSTNLPSNFCGLANPV